MTRRVLRPALALPMVLLAAALCRVPEAAALPRYSARYGQNCTLCHQNPTGGGLRTLYASQYLVPAELAMRPGPEGAPTQAAAAASGGQPAALPSPQLNAAVTVGVDLRTLFYQGETGRGSIVDMQGDLYVAVQADPRFSLYLDHGKTAAEEFFGMAYLLPANGYLKTGRFTPAYGWRFDAHQMAGRRYLLSPEGSDVPAQLNDAGLEVGIFPGRIEASASVLSGAGQNGQSHAARLVVRRSLGPWNLALGGSLLRRQELAGHRRAAGGFGYIACGPATWLWQVDETRAQDRTGMLVSQEFGLRLRQGMDLRLTYSFQDPDIGLETGTRSRWGVGIDALPYPYCGALLMANLYDSRQGPLVDQDDYYQVELVLHFLY